MKTLLKPANHLSMFSVAEDEGNLLGLLLSGTAKPRAAESAALDCCEISQHLGFRQVSYPEAQNRRKNDMGMPRSYTRGGM